MAYLKRPELVIVYNTERYNEAKRGEEVVQETVMVRKPFDLEVPTRMQAALQQNYWEKSTLWLTTTAQTSFQTLTLGNFVHSSWKNFPSELHFIAIDLFAHSDSIVTKQN